MSKKLMAGILLGVAGLGVIGGCCYNSMPSFKNAINNIFKHSDTKANISFDTDDSTSNDDNAIKPIQPEEFLKTYKYELPTSFLGGELYVKVLSNKNLLVSCSVAEGLLFCNATTGKVTQLLYEFTKWQYCYELESGNCLLSSPSNGSGLAMFNSTDETANIIYTDKYGFSEFHKSPTGDYILCNTDAIVCYKEETNTIQVFVDSWAQRRWILPNGNILYAGTTSMSGLSLFNVTNLSSKKLSVSFPVAVKVLRNGYCLVSSISSSSSNGGLFLYNIYDDNLIEIFTSGYNYHSYSVQLTDDILFISGHNSSPFLYRISDSSKISLSDVTTSFRYDKFMPLINGDWLLYSSSGGAKSLVLFKCEDTSVTLIDSTIVGYIEFEVLSNGEVIIVARHSSSVSNMSGILLYTPGGTSTTPIYSSGYYWNIRKPLSNGNCLIASDTTKTLLLYDSTSKSIKTLLTGFTVSAITEQVDGTYLIETSDEFDYEYDATTDTIRLVYKVES